MAEYKPHPGIAAVLSFIFTGLGQLYNGEIKKGLWIIFFSGLSMIFIVLGAIFIWKFLVDFLSLKILVTGGLLFLAGVVLICILGAYSIFEAYNYSNSKN
jgi:hypothetical protein